MKDFFETVVGKENISEEIGDKEVYSTDASGIQGRTRLVVWIENPKQAHQIILYAKRTKMNIVARGGGSNLVGGVVPNNSIVMDFSRMNKVLEKDKEYVIVEPGITVDELNNKIGKYFPIVPGSSKVSTIGGMIAMNSLGLESYKYGSVKDWVLGLKILDGTGKTKNLSGKDVEEFCGSEGCAGIIIEAKLKVIDKIEKKSLDVFKLEDIESLIDKVFELRRDKEIIGLHFMNSLAAKLSGFSDINYVIVEYEGFKGNIKDEVRIKKILDLLGTLNVYLGSYDYKIVQDPKIDLENVAEFLYWLKNNNIPCYGQIGLGVLYPCFKSLTKVKEMFLFIDKYDAEVTSGHGVGLLKKDFVKEIGKVRFNKLKEKYDPNRVLGKGKVV